MEATKSYKLSNTTEIESEANQVVKVQVKDAPENLMLILVKPELQLEHRLSKCINEKT